MACSNVPFLAQDYVYIRKHDHRYQADKAMKCGLLSDYLTTFIKTTRLDHKKSEYIGRIASILGKASPRPS